MAREWLERDDLSVFVVAGAPKGFNRRLKQFLNKELGDDTESMRVNDDLGDWVLARVQGEYRRDSQRTPASMALWRAFRALAAARYHLRGDEKREAQLRKLRDKVESYWLEASPMIRGEAEGDGRVPRGAGRSTTEASAD